MILNIEKQNIPASSRSGKLYSTTGGDITINQSNSANIPNLQTVLTQGNKTDHAIILSNNSGNTFTIYVDNAGNLQFSGNTEGSALFSGDVAAYSIGSPTSTWWTALGGFVDNNTIVFENNQLKISSGFTGGVSSWNDLQDKPVFSSVAFSGNYQDLSNKPSLFSGNYTDLTNKPSLFSGSYIDLTNKPDLSIYQPISTAWNTSNLNPDNYLLNTYLAGRAINNPDSAATGGISAYYNTLNSPISPDSALLTLAYSQDWAWQLAGDWRTGNFKVRGKNNSVWGNWYEGYNTGNLNRSDIDFTAKNINANEYLGLSSWPYNINIGSTADASTVFLKAGSTSGQKSFINIVGGGAPTDAGSIVFGTSSTERMRIDNSGNLCLSNGTISHPNGVIRLYGNLHIDSYNSTDIYLQYYSNRDIQVFGHTHFQGRNVDGIANLTATDYYSNNWFRSCYNNTGWYSDPNQTGIYSDGFKQVRVYNSGSFIVDNTLTVNNSSLQVNSSGGLQIRLNSSGQYYGAIGNPSAQVWSLGISDGTSFTPKITWDTTGNLTAIGNINTNNKVKSASNESQSFKILNSNDEIVWTIDTEDVDTFLQFKNAAGQIVAQISQDGNLEVKGDITAFAF